MRADTVDRRSEPRTAESPPAPERRCRLTTTELLHLGLHRFGYLRVVEDAGGEQDIIIFGADGLAVGRADSAECAVDLACQLGLALIPVH